MKKAIIACAITALLVGGGTATAAKTGLITGRDIKDGTVTGKDIKDHSLTAKDFKGVLHAGPPGPAGAKGDAGPAGPQGATGSPGSPGANGFGSTVGGSLPDSSLSFTTGSGTQTKTVGTVGPFTVKLQCDYGLQGGGPTDWYTWVSLRASVSGMPDRILAVGSVTGWHGPGGVGANFGTVEVPGVGKLGVTVNVDATQTTCSASNIKTYLSS